MDAIAAFAEHVVEADDADLPAAAVAATKTFVLDSLGVAVAGSGGPWVRELVDACGAWGAGEGARVWVRGTILPAPAAAMCNGYQTHNSEYDCVHEAAVVHPMAVLLSAAMAYAEQARGVSGHALLTAIALGSMSLRGSGSPRRRRFASFARRPRARSRRPRRSAGSEASMPGP